MNIRNLIQEKLDKILLQYGIMSHHIRRIEVDLITDENGKQININNNEYVIYRVASNKKRFYADGKATATQYYIDINYYYEYTKENTQITNAEQRVDLIINELLKDSHFKLVNGQNDLYDLDNLRRGINVEFSYLGVRDYGNQT